MRSLSPTEPARSTLDGIKILGIIIPQVCLTLIPSYH